jgi:hypothetical protein
LAIAPAAAEAGQGATIVRPKVYARMPTAIMATAEEEEAAGQIADGLVDVAAGWRDQCDRRTTDLVVTSWCPAPGSFRRGLKGLRVGTARSAISSGAITLPLREAKIAVVQGRTPPRRFEAGR